MTRIFPPPETVWGTGAVMELSSTIERRGAASVLIVTDQGVADAGVVDHVRDVLSIDHRVFDGVSSNPDRTTVTRAAAAREGEDIIVGVGGGSVLDVAKVAAAMPTVEDAGNPDPIDGLSERPVEEPIATPDAKIPLVLIPTTAGTGSETGHWAVISDHDRREKLSIGHPVLRAETGILDPALTTSLPSYMTAASGFDVLSHAVEALVSTGDTPLTRPAAAHAFDRAMAALPDAVSDGTNLDARSTMLAASYLAGWAMNNAGLGAVHGISHAIGGRYDTPHGHTNALLLPAIIHHNGRGSDRADRIYRELAGDTSATATSLAEQVDDLRRSIGLDDTLPGLPDDPDWDAVAELAVDNVNTATNPVSVSHDDVVRLCRAAFG